MRMIFIRHGQTTGDVENRYGGAYDDHLTPEGIQQAEVLRTELKDKGIKRIITSSFIRARETSEILSRNMVSIEIEPGIKERNQYGILTGELRTEALEKHPDLVEALKDRTNTIEGAESDQDFRQRLQEAFDRLSTTTDHDCIAIVWHGGPMKVLFRDILKMGELANVGNCGWVELRKEGDQFVIVDSKRIEFLF